MFSRMKDRVQQLWRRLREAAEQFYTPQQLRALAIFILVGVSVGMWRGGRKLYLTYFPELRTATEQQELKAQDSLFSKLSARAAAKDSLFFSVPEDSLLSPSRRKKLEHHVKGENLKPHSIAINTAGREELMQLPGVGPATADQIIAYRHQRKRFRSIDELRNIHGFGKKRIAKIRDYLRLD